MGEGREEVGGGDFERIILGGAEDTGHGKKRRVRGLGRRRRQVRVFHKNKKKQEEEERKMKKKKKQEEEEQER